MSDVDHEHYLRIAMQEAHKAGSAGNIAVGSVIVRGGEVIGAGHNTVNSTHDLTAHAEICAIRDAGTRTGSMDLDGAVLYTTMEPCPMCLWAICIARIDRLVLGARHAAFHRPELGEYSVEKLLAMTGTPLQVDTDVLVAECEALRGEISRS